jgi:hypothetical protein
MACIAAAANAQYNLDMDASELVPGPVVVAPVPVSASGREAGGSSLFNAAHHATTRAKVLHDALAGA